MGSLDYFDNQAGRHFAQIWPKTAHLWAKTAQLLIKLGAFNGFVIFTGLYSNNYRSPV